MTLLASILAYAPLFGGPWRLLMLLPLALAISIVHKTIKQPHLRDVPLAALLLWLTIVAAMAGLGVGLLVLYNLVA